MPGAASGRARGGEFGLEKITLADLYVGFCSRKRGAWESRVLDNRVQELINQLVAWKVPKQSIIGVGVEGVLVFTSPWQCWPLRF